MFGPNSRYCSLEIAKGTLPDGKEVTFVRRRIVPQPERFALLQYHVVTQGERPDHVAFEFLGDAEQFWRICDANRVMHPDELTAVIGQRVRITLPEGIPGPGNG
jgi:hypothetical protein